MKKSDLEAGMAAKRRDGRFSNIVTKEGIVYIPYYNSSYGKIDTDKLNNDLTNNGTGGSDWDIIELFKPKGLEFVSIWKRTEEPEFEEMTLAEICELTGKNIKIIK